MAITFCRFLFQEMAVLQVFKTTLSKAKNIGNIADQAENSDFPPSVGKDKLI